MDILPIDTIRDEDAPLVGPALVTLARLHHLGFPTEKGVAVIPPEIHLRTVLKHFNLKNKEIFEQSLTIIKKEIQQIPIPKELEDFCRKKDIHAGKIWIELLSEWIEEIRKRVWNRGLTEGIALNLSAHPLFVTEVIKGSGKAFFDELEKKVVIELEKGSLKEVTREEIEKLVLSANKKLLIPQVYSWITTGGGSNLKLIGISPYTPTHPTKEAAESLVDDLLLPKKEGFKFSVKPLTSVKVFMEMGESYVVSGSADGAFLEGEKYKDTDSKILHLVEAANSFPNGFVIYKLADIVEKTGGVRGTLRLNHEESLLKKEAEVFLFARNKKQLLNAHIAVPFVRSVNEFLQIKRNLAALGIARKGTLKLWMEVCVPENIINIEDYLEAGIDGVVINLGELSSWVGGFDQNWGENIYYRKQVSALVKMLEDCLRILHKAGVAVILKGELALDDEFIKLSISKGVFGIIASYISAESLHEHLNFFEKRHVRASN